MPSRAMIFNDDERRYCARALRMAARRWLSGTASTPDEGVTLATRVSIAAKYVYLAKKFEPESEMNARLKDSLDRLAREV